ncbi:hypothetical protein [Hydrogenophaga sp. BPS33]|uniref:hypothetical protein n=1 Tax=Hydrogenophaga sp. BPS33 TaxID=2651974 RepID=UPI00131FC31D|nr:hypothetical protein [Hydrogenophaga sp. BPS33]QHE84489.1 hypothetical protein F9K07_06095 [Hydrogenophaga sp. BPS33]
MAKKLRRSGTQVNHVNASNASVYSKGRASDQMAEVSIVLQAQLALERLISTDDLDTTQASIPLSRAGLGALLHVINTEMQRRIDAIADTTTALLMQLAESESMNRVGSERQRSDLKKAAAGEAFRNQFNWFSGGKARHLKIQDSPN